MKKLLLKFTALLIPVFFLAGCTKRNYFELAPEDYAWVNVYSVNQKIIFSDTAGITRSYTAYHEDRGYKEEGKS